MILMKCYSFLLILSSLSYIGYVPDYASAFNFQNLEN
jgi:hypothetical protein